MTRILLCLAATLAIGLLAPTRTWSDPERPVFDVPEYENSGDDDEPQIHGPAILQPPQDRRAETVPAPAPPQTRKSKTQPVPQWLSNLLDRFPLLRGHHNELLR
jgi:hypothetical protein